eukprot:scaffold239297_cov33-Tisochrysis_lutea.AAC.3
MGIQPAAFAGVPTQRATWLVLTNDAEGQGALNEAVVLSTDAELIAARLMLVNSAPMAPPCNVSDGGIARSSWRAARVDDGQRPNAQPLARRHRNNDTTQGGLDSTVLFTIHALVGQHERATR